MTLKISVVTISYNEENVIEKTIISVINQLYENVEYIVIDGGSKDKTLDIINRYNTNIQHLISEPDNGIYDAMNKALNYASGDYIIFMNSGDVFNTNTVISDIFFKHYNFDVIYGHTNYIIDEKLCLVKASRLAQMRFKLPFCHQSVFVKTKIMKKYYFDTNFKIIADFDFFHKLYFKNYSFKNVNEIISICNTYGISNTKNNKKLIYDERQIIIGGFLNFIFLFSSKFNSIIKQYIKKLL